MSNGSAAKNTPWHLWVAGVIGILWNSYGCYDFVMSVTRGEAYLREAGMTEEQIAYFFAMPSWMTAVWAVGVWGAFLGAVLLLLRSKWAFEVFVASLLGFVMSLVYTYVIVPSDVDHTMMMLQCVIFAACVFFIWYAHWMRKAGHLR